MARRCRGPVRRPHPRPRAPPRPTATRSPEGASPSTGPPTRCASRPPISAATCSTSRMGSTSPRSAGRSPPSPPRARRPSGTRTRRGPGSGFATRSAAGRSAGAWPRRPAAPNFPEIGTQARGKPFKGSTPYTEATGLADMHNHVSAYEFLGGRAHCGRPWHRYGVTQALVDCPDHYPDGSGAILENLFYGDPTRKHDPVGWPTFADWPAYDSLTHEQTYWRWLERAWLGGERLMVNNLVENGVLCRAYPFKQNSCDESDAVRLQARRMYELQDYIDAQFGGPGEGFFRIVTNPFQARRVINDGKLAIVLGIEESELFGCTEFRDAPQCTLEDVKAGIEEFKALGVSSLYPIHKFDNAFGGTRFDGGGVGAVINQGQFAPQRPLLGGRGVPGRRRPTTRSSRRPRCRSREAPTSSRTRTTRRDRGGHVPVPRFRLRTHLARGPRLPARAPLQRPRPHRPGAEADRPDDRRAAADRGRPHERQGARRGDGDPPQARLLRRPLGSRVERQALLRGDPRGRGHGRRPGQRRRGLRRGLREVRAEGLAEVTSSAGASGRTRTASARCRRRARTRTRSATRSRRPAAG